MAKKSSKEDIAEFKAVMEILSEKVPQLIDSIVGGIYSKAKAKQVGESVAEFYKNLKAGGMPDDKAFELTKEYMQSISAKSFLHKIFHTGGGGEAEEKKLGAELADEIKRKVEEGLRKKL